jgi:hypothetical protein
MGGTQCPSRGPTVRVESLSRRVRCRRASDSPPTQASPFAVALPDSASRRRTRVQSQSPFASSQQTRGLALLLANGRSGRVAPAPALYRWQHLASPSAPRRPWWLPSHGSAARSTRADLQPAVPRGRPRGPTGAKKSKIDAVALGASLIERSGTGTRVAAHAPSSPAHKSRT